MLEVNVVGGGLAGCEAAYALARNGIRVKLWEMRPVKNTPVHQTAYLSELVCSNSLKSEMEDTAQGLLKKEMRIMGSILLNCAEKVRVPAGSALAVDREEFARTVTQAIISYPGITVLREEIKEIPEGITIIASGPLTSEALSAKLAELTGEDSLYFYDAVAPSVSRESLDENKIFKASRYGKGSADYYNCPLTAEEYEIFYQNLVNSDINEGHSVDKALFFEGCIPIEIMARRGKDTLRYGPMRPVGLKAPEKETAPYAVLQLRQEDREGRVYGLVGFQTRLKWGEQARVLRLIPGLEKAEFVRYGVMHRNTYINSPRLLSPTLQFKKRHNLFFAGQITGVEGYMESAATGIIAGLNAALLARNQKPLTLSANTMLGALLHFISSARDNTFQPINANFGLLPPLEKKIKDKKSKYLAYQERAIKEMSKYSELLAKTL